MQPDQELNKSFEIKACIKTHFRTNLGQPSLISKSRVHVRRGLAKLFQITTASEIHSHSYVKERKQKCTHRYQRYVHTRNESSGGNRMSSTAPLSLCSPGSRVKTWKWNWIAEHILANKATERKTRASVGTWPHQSIITLAKSGKKRNLGV